MSERNYQLLTELFSGDITPEELEAISEELRSTPEGERLYREIKEILDLSRRPEPDEMPAIDKEWALLAQRLGLNSAEQSADSANRVRLPKQGPR